VHHADKIPRGRVCQHVTYDHRELGVLGATKHPRDPRWSAKFIHIEQNVFMQQVKLGRGSGGDLGNAKHRVEAPPAGARVRPVRRVCPKQLPLVSCLPVEYLRELPLGSYLLVEHFHFQHHLLRKP
jgi:hypothetical protein